MNAAGKHGFPACFWILFLMLPGLPGCTSHSGDDTAAGSGHSSAQFIEVSLNGGDAMAVNGVATSREDFANTVQQTVDPERSTVVIRITAEDTCPMGELAAVQDGLRDRGLLNLVYRGAAGQELALILPAADQPLPPVPAEHLARLQVVAGGRISLDGVAVEPETVRRMIADRVARDDHLVVALDLDPDASYGTFIRTFDAVKQAKADRIQLNVRG